MRKSNRARLSNDTTPSPATAPGSAQGVLLPKIGGWQAPVVPDENSRALARFRLRTPEQSFVGNATPWANGAILTAEDVGGHSQQGGASADSMFDIGSADWFENVDVRAADGQTHAAAPDGTTQSPFIYTPPETMPNGCGPEGQPWIMAETGRRSLTPEQQECCNIHDVEYSELDGAGKAAADAEFCNGLRSEVEKNPYDIWQRVTSANMCAAVKLFGQSAFDQAQSEAREAKDNADRLNGEIPMFDLTSPHQATEGQSEDQRRRNSPAGKAKLVASYAAESLKQWVQDSGNAAVDGITSTTTDAVNWAADNAKAVGDGITSATTDATDWATDNVKAVGDTISSVIDEFEYHARSVMPVQVY